MPHAASQPPISAGAKEVSSSAYIQTELSWVRTKLSTERTFLSWTRTATTLVGFGFTMYQFLPTMAVREVTPDQAKVVGMAFIGAGIVVQVVGIVQWRAENAFSDEFDIDGIGQDDELPKWRFSWIFAAIVILTGLIAMAWIATS
jgi:uncharacterized membrane protein YidH (DUF202 family)